MSIGPFGMNPKGTSGHRRFRHEATRWASGVFAKLGFLCIRRTLRGCRVRLSFWKRGGGVDLGRVCDVGLHRF